MVRSRMGMLGSVGVFVDGGGVDGKWSESDPRLPRGFYDGSYELLLIFESMVL